MPSLCFSGRFRNTAEQHPFAYGAVGSDRVAPDTQGPPESALGLPSPVDAFHRPQAPAPPHVTTPHERAPRVDGKGTTNHARNRLSRTFFRNALHCHARFDPAIQSGASWRMRASLEAGLHQAQAVVIVVGANAIPHPL